MLAFIVFMFWFSMGMALNMTLSELKSFGEKAVCLTIFLTIFHIYVWR